MRVNLEVIIEKGPDERGNHIGSAVVQRADRRLWISTIDLRREPKAYETLVLALPQEVELTHDPDGTPVFSKDFDLREVKSGDIPGVFNTTNMPNELVARRNHGEMVQAAVRALDGIAS